MNNFVDITRIFGTPLIQIPINEKIGLKPWQVLAGLAICGFAVFGIKKAFESLNAPTLTNVKKPEVAK